ncbi:MAG: hypothetical protein E6K08_04690 [Methanobacteriota archaeon]|nr:MAG: hypothetical protein E6K08_04690 [Euryarchaeota archaeon]
MSSRTSCTGCSIHVFESEPGPPRSESIGPVLIRRLRRVLLTSWTTLRQSRLGVLGFSIVMVFALMAILAPVIAPYPRLYEAPLIDRFDIHAFNRALPQNQSYEVPVIGPTTPLFPDVGGGEWTINSNTSHATIYMDFMKYPAKTNESPFLTRDLSLRFDATQLFNASPLPSPPLSAIYWIAPGKNISFETGPPDKNGALAFFMNRDFIVGDPFTNAEIFRATLPFVPVWTGEDPESAGNLISQPTQRQGPSCCFGVPGPAYGPYRYFYASNGTSTLIFEITYVHTGDQTPGISPSGRVALSFNGTLSAPPFVYYHWAGVSDVDGSGFRAGERQAILLPLANHTLAVYNVSGIPRAYVPLSLLGQPANVVAPIGYARSPDTPTFFAYLQLRSSNASAIATFDIGRLRIAHVFPLPQASLELLESPISELGTALYLGFYDASVLSGGHALPRLRIHERAAGHSLYGLHDLCDDSSRGLWSRDSAERQANRIRGHHEGPAVRRLVESRRVERRLDGLLDGQNDLVHPPRQTAGPPGARDISLREHVSLGHGLHRP